MYEKEKQDAGLSIRIQAIEKFSNHVDTRVYVELEREGFARVSPREVRYRLRLMINTRARMSATKAGAASRNAK